MTLGRCVSCFSNNLCIQRLPWNGLNSRPLFRINHEYRVGAIDEVHGWVVVDAVHQHVVVPWPPDLPRDHASHVPYTVLKKLFRPTYRIKECIASHIVLNIVPRRATYVNQHVVVPWPPDLPRKYGTYKTVKAI